jgi:hypothetical protein
VTREAGPIVPRFRRGLSISMPLRISSRCELRGNPGVRTGFALGAAVLTGGTEGGGEVGQGGAAYALGPLGFIITGKPRGPDFSDRRR